MGGVLLGLVAAGASLIALDPDARLKGWLTGEPFFAGRSASGWVTAARSPDANTRSAAANDLAAGGANAIPVLVVLLRADGSPEPRQLAADVLGRIGKPDALPAGDALISALGDPDPLVRDVATKAIIKLAPDLAIAVPALVKRFPDADAIRAVSAYRGVAVVAVPDLIPLLTHENPTVRWNAARILGKIGELAKPAVPVIVAQLQDADPLVREHAAEALGDIGPAAAASIPSLVKVLGDSEWKVRRDAVRSLGNMGSAAKGVLAEVRRMTEDANPEVRAAADRASRIIDPSTSGKK